MEEVPAAKGVSYRLAYPQTILVSIPFQVFLVVGEYLAGFRNDPDLPHCSSDLDPAVSHCSPTYLGVVFDVLWMRDECHRLALEENLFPFVNSALVHCDGFPCSDVAYHSGLRQTSPWLARWRMSVGVNKAARSRKATKPIKAS